MFVFFPVLSPCWRRSNGHLPNNEKAGRMAPLARHLGEFAGKWLGMNGKEKVSA